MDTSHEISKIIEEIDNRGFCIIPSVISAEKADEARLVLERLLEEEATAETRAARTQRVGGIAYKHKIFLELMAHPFIVKLWQAYLSDEDIICCTWSANTAYPGYDKFAWHPDYPYWWINRPWPLEKVCGQTIWLLDDFSAENGGTGILPHTHRKGHPPPREMAREWQPEAEILRGVRGSVMVFHGAAWHTARPNQTDKARSALLGMYMRPFFVTQEDMSAQLAKIDNPSAIVRQLMGAKRHQPGIIGA